MTRVLLSLGIWVLLTATASAANLFGKVVEINDGDTLTIYNLNKPVKIRLIGVAAPGTGQPYADIAKQHLSDLILFRSVSVEYSGLVENNYLQGKVFYKEMDVGAQMLRDGVAWFEPSSSNRLTEVERQVYAQCESAARAERRGLWQDPEPVSPWDFKQQQALKALVATQPKNSSPKRKPETKQTLVSEDLFAGLTGGSARRSSTAAGTADFEWRKLTPENHHFSVMVPGQGYETTVSHPQGSSLGTTSVWLNDYDGAAYMLLWSSVPNYAYSDESAIDEVASGFVEGANRIFKARGIDFSYELVRQRNLNVNHYFGIQYSLTARDVPGVLRIFSKRVGNNRTIYMLGVLRRTEKDPSVEKFFSSLNFAKN